MKNSISLALLAIIICFLLIWNINSGSAHLSVGEIGGILFRRTGEAAPYRIVWGIRLPRILLATILGGALSVSDFLLQAFFASPTTDPFVLETLSGAKLVVSPVMIILLGRGISIGLAGMILTAFAGSMVSIGFVLMISGKVKKMSILVICGMMIGYVCSTITDFVVAFAENTNIVNLHNWFMGSFSGTSWESVSVMAIMVFLSPISVFPMAKPTGTYQTGEVYAQNTGVNILQFRMALILLSSIPSAYVTAFAGPMSSVGVAIPYPVESLFETAKPIFMIPGCFLGGAVFCLFCDLTARTVFASTGLSINSATTTSSAPVVIYMMVHNRKGIQ